MCVLRRPHCKLQLRPTVFKIRSSCALAGFRLAASSYTAAISAHHTFLHVNIQCSSADPPSHHSGIFVATVMGQIKPKQTFFLFSARVKIRVECFGKRKKETHRNDRAQGPFIAGPHRKTNSHSPLWTIESSQFTSHACVWIVGESRRTQREATTFPL